MAIVDDEMKEDVDYSSLLDSLNSNLTEGVVSLEDVAWADSCINKDTNSSKADWSSIKDALLEILISQQEPLSSAVAESSRQPGDDEILHSRENVTSLELGKGSDVVEYFMYDDTGEVKSTGSSDDDEGDFILGNKHRTAKNRIGNVFRPNYTEDSVRVEKLDSGLDLGLTTCDVEPSSEDIFKVWDLGVPYELDDFSKQLNKALDDSTSWKDCMNASVDDLITGIGALSLTHSTR